VPRLIVNADDLGLTSGVNRAIAQAHRDGIVTSATLMANAPAFSEAVSLLQSMPQYVSQQISIGCHIVLVDGTPVSASQAIPTLIDGGAARGNPFHKKLWKFALAALRGKISVCEVEVEASAQIRRLQDAGIAISHLDCHKHTHMFPPILEGVLRAAVANGIRAIRNPFEPAFARPARLAFHRSNLVRSAETSLLNRKYARRFDECVRRFGLSTTDGSLGVTLTGTLDAKGFAETIRSLPADGTYEFVCHPGYDDQELASTGTRLLRSRETELQLLSSPGARTALQAAHVKLINFWDLLFADESKVTASHPMP
jgi:predicted glycoside hydrolase/deacetylase ChbG (UPF0249 family)